MSFDRSLIDRFESDADAPARMIEGLTRDDLLWRPPPGDSRLGAWSMQELVVHLMDSHVMCATRMRRIIAEQLPLLTAYDESAFVRHCAYDTTDAQAAAEIFMLVQRLNAGVLRTLPDAAFDRAGIHTERGRVTLGQLVPDYIEHVAHHMRFAKAKREAIGKPMA